MPLTSYAQPRPSDAIDAATRRVLGGYRLTTLGHREALEELHDTWCECREQGWDGYGARPVDQDSYAIACRLIECLPLGFDKPSIGADPDGQLTLEWHKSRFRVLSVSVDPSGVLHYAGLFGAEKRNGTMIFFEGVPEELVALVEKL